MPRARSSRISFWMLIFMGSVPGGDLDEFVGGSSTAGEPLGFLVAAARGGLGTDRAGAAGQRVRAGAARAGTQRGDRGAGGDACAGDVITDLQRAGGRDRHGHDVGGKAGGADERARRGAGGTGGDGAGVVVGEHLLADGGGGE